MVANNSNSNSDYYSSLDFDDALSVTDGADVQVTPVKKPRVPPVVLQNHSGDAVVALLKNSSIVKYNLKLMSIGVKVFLDDSNDRDLFIASLKSNKIGFFTYASKESRPLKFVMSGLDCYAIDDIFKELVANGLPCVDVKLIKPKIERFKSQTNYLVYFKKGASSFNDLMQCRSLFNTIIYWSPWRKNKSSVTQCHRCQMFGHGEDHCHLKIKCQKCSGNHPSADCTQSTIKCVNCGESHISSDPSCPKRGDYLNILERVRQRSRSGRSSKPFVQLSVNHSNFPALPRKSQRVQIFQLLEYIHIITIHKLMLTLLLAIIFLVQPS